MPRRDQAAAGWRQAQACGRGWPRCQGATCQPASRTRRHAPAREGEGGLLGQQPGPGLAAGDGGRQDGGRASWHRRPWRSTYKRHGQGLCSNSSEGEKYCGAETQASPEAVLDRHRQGPARGGDAGQCAGGTAGLSWAGRRAPQSQGAPSGRSVPAPVRGRERRGGAQRESSERVPPGAARLLGRGTDKRVPMPVPLSRRRAALSVRGAELPRAGPPGPVTRAGDPGGRLGRLATLVLLGSLGLVPRRSVRARFCVSRRRGPHDGGRARGGLPWPPLAVRLSGDGAQGQQAVLCPPSLSPGGRVTSRCPRARALQLVRLIGPSRATCRCPHPCHARSSRPAGSLPTRSWPSASRVLVLRFVTCWWRWLQLASPLSPGLGRSPWPPLRARAREQDCFGGVLPEWMWGTTVLSPTAAAQRVPGRRQSPGSGRGPRVSAA